MAIIPKATFRDFDSEVFSKSTPKKTPTNVNKVIMIIPKHSQIIEFLKEELKYWISKRKLLPSISEIVAVRPGRIEIDSLFIASEISTAILSILSL